MKLFIENNKGYVETLDNVYKVSIKKINNKNNLIVYYNSLKTVDMLLLADLKLAFLLDVDTMHEYFRYEK